MFKTHRLIRAFYPELTWKIQTTEKVIFLTFDDGPAPSVTDYVLSELRRCNARATFFCVGDNILKRPGSFENIVRDGHRVGNHTFNHLNGWKTSIADYAENIGACQKIIDSLLPRSKRKIFRPPYGRIKKGQAKLLVNDYDIIMWDVLSRDFDESVSAEKCLINSIKATGKGSIVVFHDSYKAEQKLTYILPRYLEHFSQSGFRFERL